MLEHRRRIQDVAKVVDVDPSGAAFRALARRGKRVLALASSKEPWNAPIEASLPPVLKAEALVVLGEQVRADVATTIATNHQTAPSTVETASDNLVLAIASSLLDCIQNTV